MTTSPASFLGNLLVAVRDGQAWWDTGAELSQRHLVIIVGKGRLLSGVYFIWLLRVHPQRFGKEVPEARLVILGVDLVTRSPDHLDDLSWVADLPF